MAPKTHAEMNIGELTVEIDAWLRVIAAPKEPGMPTNTAREAAALIYRDACAWLARRMMEQTPPVSRK